MEEHWKDIQGYEGLYMVSDMGRVKNSKSGRIRKLQTYKTGYVYVHLRNREISEYPTVHMLVAEAFIPNPENKPEVHHINEDKSDNRVENLMWVTKEEHAALHKDKYDKIADMSSIPVYQYTLDGEFVREWKSAEEIQRQLGYKHGNIWACCNGIYASSNNYQWSYTKHDKMKSIKTPAQRTAEKQSSAVEQYTKDWELVAEYPSMCEAARQTGYSQGFISLCCTGKKELAYGYRWKKKEPQAS